MQFERIDVSKHSGFKAGERPVSFIWRGREFQIYAIIDRWYDGGCKPEAPAFSYFKARIDNGRHYILRHNSLFDEWALVVPPEPAG
jgi:hypothetical protein